MQEARCDKLQVSIFHYHLLPGGVTDVIMGWLRILASNPQIICPQYRKVALRVCCGRADNIAKLKQQWQNWKLQGSETSRSIAVSLEFLVDKEIDYHSLPDSPAFAERSSEQQALSWQAYVQSLAAHLLHHYAQTAQRADEEREEHTGWDHLWWIHNFHLGKNVAYSKALLQIIQNQLSQTRLGAFGQQAPRLKFLLHIHDFPECGRFERYSELLQSQQWLDRAAAISALSIETPSTVQAPLLARLYPVGSDVCYATINHRDYKILKEAGLPPQRLFFLPNPLKFHDLNVLTAPAEQLQAQLSKVLGLNQPEKPIALYPVRCIRRKNVLELAFLNTLADERWNLVCTLPGLSQSERPYSDLVENLYRQGIIQGCYRAGLELEQHGFSFDSLCQAASLICSSSIMEGFGFTYFNPMYWGKALLARQLDVLEGFGHCFQPKLSLFYQKLQIPLVYGTAQDFYLHKMYQELRQKYRIYLDQLPTVSRSTMQAELEQRLGEEVPPQLDFAYFSIDQQLQLLYRLKSGQPADQKFAAACLQANAVLLEQMDALPTLEGESESLALARDQIRERIEHEFAPARLAQILRQACAALFPMDSQGALPNTNKNAREPTESSQEDPLAVMAAISQKVLHSYSKLEYNYVILWDSSWKTQLVSADGPCPNESLVPKTE